jgi:carboxyl-terminal processing protease
LIDIGTLISATFIEGGPLYTIRNRGQEVMLDGRDAVPKGIKIHLNFPIVCLINGDTNRMAEVVAACLQDNKRAIIVGERSAGNTPTDALLRVDSGQLLRVTSGIFFRPNGKKLDRIHPPGKPSDEWGVTPDKGYELIFLPKERDELRAHFEKQLEIWPAGHAKRETPKIKDRQLELAVESLRGKLARSE